MKQPLKLARMFKAEMERLNTILLSPFQFKLYVSTHLHYTLALLNVRSLYAKLADIDCDDSLAYASILCFTETWLTPQMETP